MSQEEVICVVCANQFTLLPTKPGYANTCPACSPRASQGKGIVAQRPSTRKRKTLNEEIRDARVKSNAARRKLNALILGKPPEKEN